MKNLFLSLVVLFAATNLPAQDGWVYSVSKDGKATHKECKAMKLELDMVVFWVSGDKYQVFDHIGNSADGSPIWADRATGKVVQRQVEDDKTVVFWKSEKKAFYYKP